MRISVAQIKPVKGNIPENIEIHEKWIKLAVSEDADFIVFPELSLTGYEPELAEKLAMDIEDSRLDTFQRMTDGNKITIALGAPTRSGEGIQISLIIFQPGRERKIYAKQILHPDEMACFTPGHEQLILNVGNEKIAPAICYESLQNEHSIQAKKLGAEFYVASVAKSRDGIEKAYKHFPAIAGKFSFPVLLSNSIGFCDTFLSTGQSAIWNQDGMILEKLDPDKEGLLLFDTETEIVIKKIEI